MSKVSRNEKIHALDNSFASVEMEGFRYSHGEKDLCMEVLDGKLSKDEFIEKLLERCNSRNSVSGI